MIIDQESCYNVVVVAGIEGSLEVMDNTKPLVSVIMPCYNHEKYVGEAIESVLNQTYDKLELIVADNGSTDNSYAVIQRYKDRITKIIQVETNDPPLCSSKLSEAAKGEYIALMTSDDYWEKEKLELQMRIFEENPEVELCTTWAVQTDEYLQPLSNKKNLFITENRNRYQWFKHFVFYGNCLAYPSAVMKRKLYDKLRNGKRGYRQLGDLYDWMRTVQEAEIYVVPQILVKFRWHRSGNNQNVSNPIEVVQNRHHNEMINIIDYFFSRMEDSYFIKAFQSEFIHTDAKSHAELLCEKFFLLKRIAETEQSYEVCVTNFYYEHYAEFIEVMTRKYHFSQTDFLEWSGTVGTHALSLRFLKLGKIAARAKRKSDEKIKGLKDMIFTNVTDRDDVTELRKALFSLTATDDRQLIMEIWNACQDAVKYMESDGNDQSYHSVVGILESMMQKTDMVWDELKFIEFPISREDWDIYKELIGYAKQEVIDLTEAVLPFTRHLQEQLEVYIR